MDDTDALLGIGAFARRVGLAPSALRFYDDCGVLRPAHVDEATGYRYYAPRQGPRATLVRRLRAAGLPLTDAWTVLDGTRAEARAVLEEHARRTRETAAAAQSAVEEILRELPVLTAGGTVARVGGAELSSAVRQVAPAVAGEAVGRDFPVLGCVLLELDSDGQEMRLVATDRYRMAVRVLRPEAVEGVPSHVVVDASGMRELASWARGLPELSIHTDGRAAAWVVGAGAESRTLPTSADTFPSYRMILDELPSPQHRLIVDRCALARTLATEGSGGPVTLRTHEQRLVVSRPGFPDTTLTASCTGPPLRVTFDPDVLLPALDASVGPDVLLEASSTAQPVVVRSADQGSFTTLVMPVHDAAAGD